MKIAQSYYNFDANNSIDSIESENNKNFIVFTASLLSSSKIKSFIKSSDEEPKEFDTLQEATMPCIMRVMS